MIQEKFAQTLEQATEKLERMSAQGRIEWAVEHFAGHLVLSTSFGAQAAVMLHMVTRIEADIPVVFIDTGYLFPETYRFAEQLCDRLKLNLKVYQPLMSAARQEALFGQRWNQGLRELEAYNLQNKVEPMNRAMQELGARAWLAGLRRNQASTRQNLQVIQQQKRTLKIHPIVDWSDRQIYQYLQAHELPYHPLWEQGYVSIGDWHSTQPLNATLDAEQTRFGGIKRECGLHEANANSDWQI